MKQNISIAAKCLVSILLLDFVCFFLYMTFTAIAIGTTTKPDYYIAYKQTEDGEMEELYTHYYADGEDKKLEEYEKQGIEVRTFIYRTEMKKSTQNWVKLLSFGLTFVILFGMVYSILWKRGDRDNNLAAFEHIRPDPLRGLKIGGLAVIPSALLYLLLFISKFSSLIPGMLGIFRIFNYYMFPIVDLAFGNATVPADISLGGFAILLLTLLPIPLIAALGYYCGYKEISVKDKLIYASNKEKK